MKHTIERKSNEAGFYGFTDKETGIFYLLGLRYMFYPICGGKFGSVFVDNYYYKTELNERGFVVFKPDVKRQQLIFSLPMYVDWNRDGNFANDIVYVYRKVSAGFHVLPVYSGVWMDNNTYAVIFRPEDITFYDGSCVTVSTFILPSSEYLINHGVVLQERHELVLRHNDAALENYRRTYDVNNR
ncbi:MAG: hypothetical protein ABIK73_06935 [candidate division WOR-3 bacterium]